MHPIYAASNRATCTGCHVSRPAGGCASPASRALPTAASADGPDTISTAMDTAIATARRDLAPRLERFLAAKRESVLTAGEATDITAALACLKSGRYPDGEDAMMLAEKDLPRTLLAWRYSSSRIIKRANMQSPDDAMARKRTHSSADCGTCTTAPNMLPPR